MPFDPNHISQEINRRNGVQRDNKFLATIMPPKAFRESRYTELKDVEYGRALQYWCEAAEFPDMSLDITPVRHSSYGMAEMRPWGGRVEPLTLVFRVDATSMIPVYFRMWQQAAFEYSYSDTLATDKNPTPGIRAFELGYHEDYTTMVNITTFDEGGQATRCVQLRDAYPMGVGKTPLRWTGKDFVRLPVVLSYMTWYDIKADGQEPAVSYAPDDI